MRLVSRKNKICIKQIRWTIYDTKCLIPGTRASCWTAHCKQYIIIMDVTHRLICFKTNSKPVWGQIPAVIKKEPHVPHKQRSGSWSVLLCVPMRKRQMCGVNALLTNSDSVCVCVSDIRPLAPVWEHLRMMMCACTSKVKDVNFKGICSVSSHLCQLCTLNLISTYLSYSSE